MKQGGRESSDRRGFKVIWVAEFKQGIWIDMAFDCAGLYL